MLLVPGVHRPRAASSGRGARLGRKLRSKSYVVKTLGNSDPQSPRMVRGVSLCVKCAEGSGARPPPHPLCTLTHCVATVCVRCACGSLASGGDRLGTPSFSLNHPPPCRSLTSPTTPVPTALTLAPQRRRPLHPRGALRPRRRPPRPPAPWPSAHPPAQPASALRPLSIEVLPPHLPP